MCSDFFEMCAVRLTKTFDGLQKDSWYRLTIDVDTFIGELSLDDGDAMWFPGFNLHLCPDGWNVKQKVLTSEGLIRFYRKQQFLLLP